MHIIIVTRVLPFHSTGGMQVITWDLAKEFVNLGARVTCLTTSIVNRPEAFTESGVRVIPLAETNSGVYSNAWWKLSKQYFKDNLAADCDVVLSVSASGYSILKLKKQTPNAVFVFQAHGTSLSEIISKFNQRSFYALITSIKNFKWLFIDILNYRKFDGIIAAGKRVYRDFSGSFYKFFLATLSVQYIPNGIDVSLFKPNPQFRKSARLELGIHEDEFLLLTASRLHKQKGIDQAVKSFHAYRNSNSKCKLLVLGSGPEENRIRNMVYQYGVSEDVVFIGSVSIKDLPYYLNACDLFVFPTLHEEGLPLLPLEALACGLPVLASNHLKEVLEVGSAVVPIDPRSTENILTAIEFSKSVEVGNISYLPEDYTLNGMAKSYLRYFKELKDAQ